MLAILTLTSAVPLTVFAASDSSGKPTDLTDDVVLAIYNGDGFPGEPAVYANTNYTRINSSFESAGSSTAFA